MTLDPKTTKEGHWLYWDKREIKIEAETDCRLCIHREVCEMKMEKRCGNYLFGTSAEKGCHSCINHYPRFDKDSVPCLAPQKRLVGNAYLVARYLDLEPSQVEMVETCRK